MFQLIATDEQATALAAAQPGQTIVVRDADGVLLAQGIWTPFVLDLTEEEIAEIIRNRNKPGPRYTTAEVLDYCRSLAPEDGDEQVANG